MSESVASILRKIAAFATGVMLVTTLSALAVIKADNKKGKTIAIRSGASSAATDAAAAADTGTAAADTSGATGTAAAAASGTSAGTSSAAGTGTGTPAAAGATSGGGGGGGGAGAAARQASSAAATSGKCIDENPEVGVFCDHYLVGGTTVLSGPLAVYGDQGLKGGLAWITYYNTVIAPRDHLRQVKLVWYDDALDPQRTLSYVQRLHDIDKVLFLSGVTSPEAISAYVQSAKFPLIGDIGLSPKSWRNRYIFPTTPSDATRNALRIKIAHERLSIKSFAVIQDVLPSVDTGPYKKSWQDAAKRAGVEEKDYVEISSTGSDCSAQFSRVIQSKPDYIILPTASGATLACLREGRKNAVQPGGAQSKWLKGWSGGSNLQIEVDNCKPTCEGMYSIGTVFSDPRTSTSEQMRIYRENMARYAPNVDITGFIAINYYHNGWLVYNMLKQAGIQNNLTRDTIMNAAEHFGPFETGFGNSVTWNTTVPREPWTCGYPVVVRGDKWVFDSQRYCL
jgi:ABC-type branched-subunit amino acid transport system substrate-binding protein